MKVYDYKVITLLDIVVNSFYTTVEPAYYKVNGDTNIHYI